MRTPYYSNPADPDKFAISQWELRGLCPGGFSVSLPVDSCVIYILISRFFPEIHWNSQCKAPEGWFVFVAGLDC